MGVAGGTDEAVDLEPGSTLGRYELLVPIASGGMARVWAARLVGQGGFSKIVALKTILPDFAGHLQFQTMFLDEARIAAKLRHPNVCETFDLGEQDGALYLTMEWVDGPSLLQMVRKASRLTIPPRLSARIVADASAGLQAAHDLRDDDGSPLKVVHRDVSPHNILVSSTGVVKVTDFGIAKAHGRSHLTAAGEVKGKVSYMAPEQLLGADDLDAGCDVWALGCVLYEIALGQRAFPGSNDAEVVSAILQGTFAKPSQLDPSCPPELERILLRALTRDRAARYATADELRQDLESWLAASGPPVASSEVAKLVMDRCGPSVDAVREKIRAACAARPSLAPRPAEPIRPPRASGVDRSEKAVSVDADRTATTSTPAPPRSRTLVAAVIALSVAAIVFGGAVWFAISRARAPIASASTSAGQGAGLVAPPTPLSPSAIAPLPTVTDSTSPRVTFRLAPKSAFLVVDGVVMPSGVDAIQRPGEGKPLRVIVRADKHEEQVVTIDARSPAVVDVVLAPRTQGSKQGRAIKPAASASAAPTAAALPNPYE